MKTSSDQSINGRFIGFALVVVVLVIAGKTSFAQETADLIAKIPADANAIIVLNVEGLSKTQRAKTEGWTARRDSENPRRAIIVPPDAKTIVVGSRLNMESNLESMWDIGLVASKSSVGINRIAQSERGYLDWIGASQAVWSPVGAYFALVDTNLLGMVSPSDRQFTARWLKWAKAAKTPVVSSYLAGAAAKVGTKSQIVLALDLQDSVQQHRLQQALLSTEPVQKNNSLLKVWGDLFTTLQGISLSISVSNDINAEMRIDFKNDPSILQPHLKSLAIKALEKHGAYLSDIENWDFTVEGNSVVAKGELSTSGLRRIGSLVELPSTVYDDEPAESESTATKTPPSAEDVKKSVLQNSQAYFTSVTTLVEDLRKTLGDTRDNHAVWFERYARKIDRLPILNVDEELLTYGQMVAETFRQIALVRRGTAIGAGVRKSQLYGNTYHPATGTNTRVNYQGDGYYGVDSGRKDSSKRSQIDREAGAQAAKVRYESWNEIENATAEMRRTMTKKYGVEF